MMDGIHYLNSGDWVESLTAIVEHYDGRYELVDFVSFCRQFPIAEPVEMETGEETRVEASELEV